MSLNRTIIQGRLVSDPELRTTTSGVSVANMRIAVERNYKDADGNKVADFFTCTAWRGTADFVEKYFHKGEQIVVDGKLQNSQYTDKDGNNRTVTQVVVDSVFFCGSKSDRQFGGTEQYSGPATAQEPQVVQLQDITEDSEDEGDLPF